MTYVRIKLMYKEAALILVSFALAAVEVATLCWLLGSSNSGAIFVGMLLLWGFQYLILGAAEEKRLNRQHLQAL